MNRNPLCYACVWISYACIWMICTLSPHTWSETNSTSLNTEQHPATPPSTPPGRPPIDVNNWLAPPNTAWSLQNVEQLVPTLSVDRGDRAIHKLPRRRQDLHTLRFEHEGTSLSMANYLAANHVDALLIWQRGRLRFELYGNEQTPRSRHMMMSVTKSVIGLLAEMMIAADELEPNKLIGDYLPELRRSAWGDATLRQLLDMEIGIKFDETYTDPDSDIARFIRASGAGPKAPGDPASLYEYLPTLHKQGEHGQDFHYVTANTEVLGWLMAKTRNQSIAHIFEQMIYRKLGAERDAYFLVDGVGKPMAGGGLNISARDLLRFALMVLHDGKLNGQQIVSRDIVERLFEGGVPRPSLFGNQRGGSEHSYRSQWYYHHPTQVLSASGIHGQNIYLHQDSGTAMVVQSSHPQPVGEFFRRTTALFRHLTTQ